jgi:hypothetical protein
MLSKVISKSAAVVAAMAMMLPVVGVATPAFSNAGSAIVASAAQDWNVATITGDQYVKVGSTFTFKVECREWVSSATYEWQICTYGSSTWTKIGSNKDTLTGTMTSDYKGAHIRCKVTNNDNGVTDYSPVRTIWSVAAAAKLGTPAKQSNGSYKIPVTLTGLQSNSIALFYPEFVVDSSQVSNVTFEYDSSFNKGDDIGSGFYQENNGANSKVPGVYVLQFATLFTPGKVGSNNTIGYLYVTPKSGVSTVKVDMKEYDGNKASLYGDNYEGNLVYGMTYTGTTIGGSSGSSTNRYPVPTVQVNGNAVKISWTKADGASRYGVGMYQNGSWRAQVQVDSKTTYITKKGLKKGTYKMVVLAKVNGEWDTHSINQRAFTFTIK